MLTRRRFVKLIGGATALATLPIGCGDNIAVTRGLFFDAHQWATIDIATGFILPTDPTAVGARDAMAVRYIDQLLAAFQVDPPAIFAGGPFSGREPYPDATGAATTMFPSNAFATFLPLSRVQEIAWRMRIYGSSQTTGGDFNDAVLGPTIGWQDLYVAGITALDAYASTVQANQQFVDLASDDQSRALDTVASAQPAFWQALVNHTLEGTFCAPEYGGNAMLAGWTLASYDGDSSPLGHSYYDETTGAYNDRADQPTSTASPGAMTETFDDAIINVLTIAAVGSGGMRFF